MKKLEECKKCRYHRKIVGEVGTILSYVYCSYGGRNYQASHKKPISKTLKVMGCTTGIEPCSRGYPI